MTSALRAFTFRPLLSVSLIGLGFAKVGEPPKPLPLARKAASASRIFIGTLSRVGPGSREALQRLSLLVWLVLQAISCLGSHVMAADAFPPAGFKEMGSDESPNGIFKIIHFKRNPEDFSSESQIWLQALKPDFKTQLLFKHFNRADWLLSPEENFIAVNHHEGSGSGLLHIFSRDRAGLFHETPKDFLETARKLMTVQLKIAKDTGFDHLYCYADYWLRDGILLAHLEGHEQGVHFLEPWCFIYDAKHDSFSWDLSKINQGAFQLVKHAKEQ